MTITIAILGAGIGQEHLKAYLKLEDKFSVRRLVDMDETRARSVAKQGHMIEVSTDISDAIDDPEIDIIDICLPPHLHVPVTLQALEAGKHVICEKPLATSMRDVDRIRLSAQSVGKSVYPVFQYRWGTPLAQLRHLRATGLTGDPVAASVETHWSRGADYYAIPWRGTWAGEQGGAVLGHAIHNHDLLTHFMGPVRALSAVTTTRVNDIETEDCAAISFELENGAVATSSITLGAAGNQSRLRFVYQNLTATSGTAPYAPGSEPWEFVARDARDQTAIDQAIQNAPIEAVGFDGFLSEVAADRMGQKNDAVSLDEGAASIALVSAIYHAARTGERVHLPIDKDFPLYGGWHP